MNIVPRAAKRDCVEKHRRTRVRYKRSTNDKRGLDDAKGNILLY